MSKDIAKRLREGWTGSPVCQEAADLLDRLREENQALRFRVQDLRTALQQLATLAVQTAERYRTPPKGD